MEVQTPLTPISSVGSPTVPSNLKTIPCTYSGCDKTFNRQAKLLQHLNSHTNTRPFVCPHTPCSKGFFRSSHLKHHIKSAHSDQRDYVCQWEGCAKRFVTSTRLKRHHELHVKRQQFACTFVGCGQEFRKHNTLQKHIAVVHEGKRKPFICDRQDVSGTACGASFDLEANLRQHVSRVHSDRNYTCTICSMGEDSFASLPALQAHIRTNHPPMCPECGSTFATNETLHQHMEAKHSNLHIDNRRKHSCPEPGCGKAFTLKSNLTKHVRATHEESKSFVCGMVDPKTLIHVEDWDGSNACGRALTTKYNLIGHIRNVHLGLGALKRSDKKKGLRSVADEALMRLTGVGYEEGRDIECLVEGCVHRFPRDYDLQRHLGSHHGLGPSHTNASQIHTDYLFARTYPTGSESVGLEDSFDDYFVELEDQAAAGGVFWFGGQDLEYNSGSRGQNAVGTGDMAEHRSAEPAKGDPAPLDPRLI